MIEQLYRIKRTLEKKINSTVFRYSNNRYAIAFRQRRGNALYEDNPSSDSFFVIKNSLRYWRADPFIFKYLGTNYLFAELYDKRKSKGVLAYAKIKGTHCGRFHVCIEEDYHLSYPCVFQRGSEIYMVPESKENGKVTLYRAISFPRKWEKYKDLCDLPCVDTTPFVFENEYYYFTTVASDKSTDDNLHLFREKDGSIQPLLFNNLCARSAGNVIIDKNQMIRPSQDDTVYGDAVVLNRVDLFGNGSYNEVPYRRLLPFNSTNESMSVCVNTKGNEKNAFNGLHTYNANDDYEVIDLRYPRLKKVR